MEKNLQEWLNLFLPHLPPDASLLDRYSWGSNIVELSFKQMIDLWDIRNKEVHGFDEAAAEEIRKGKTIEEIRQYFALQLVCCPVDQTLFPDNTEEFIHKTSSKGLQD